MINYWSHGLLGQPTSHFFATPNSSASSTAKFGSQVTILVIASPVLSSITPSAKEYIIQFQRHNTDLLESKATQQVKQSKSCGQNTLKSWMRKQPVWSQHQITTISLLPLEGGCRQDYILKCFKGHLRMTATQHHTWMTRLKIFISFQDNKMLFTLS